MAVGTRIVSMLVVAMLAGHADRSFSQDDEDYYDEEEEESHDWPWIVWDAVERFRGQASILITTWTDRSDEVWVERNSSSEYTTLTFELVREPQLYSVGNSRWVPVRAEASGGGSWNTLDRTPTHRLTGSWTVEFGQPLAADPDISLTLNHETGEFELILGGVLEHEVIERGRRVEWNLGRGTTHEIREQTTTSFASTNFYGQAPLKIGTLTDSEELDFVADDGGDGWEKTGRVVLVPEWGDYEVIVALEGQGEKGSPVAYEEWRPLGSIAEPGTPGNYLIARAMLKAVDPKRFPKLPEVSSFRFELVGTSQEPGVAMNWPRNATDDLFDFQFMPIAHTQGRLGEKAQTFEVFDPRKNADGQPSAEVRINSLDFGGRTDLRVVARLDDGREIHGRLESGDRRYDVIQLPKRLYGEWIADSWREKHEVTALPDDDDSEDKPDGDGDNGDGLTLYEEYRGFSSRLLRSGRVEGDPKRKDLFVLNLIGSDARPGLERLARESGLRVVHYLARTDVDPFTRVINANFLDAPHSRDKSGVSYQHGIILKTRTPQMMGGHGAATQAIGSSGKAFRPRTVEFVAMPNRDDPKADTNKPHNLAADDIAAGYDRTIVHEMLHAVGVDHHGTGDYTTKFNYLPPEFSRNTQGRATLWFAKHSRERGWFQSGFADVFDEKTGESWVDTISAEYEAMLAEETRRLVADRNLPPETRFTDFSDEDQADLVMSLPSFMWTTGAERGPHSGDEQCPLRYKFAKVYPKRGLRAGPREVFYRVPPGTEDIGFDICESDEGTGVNAPVWTPQSRYGAAADNFGKCSMQICVNDAVPLHDWGWKRP